MSCRRALSRLLFLTIVPLLAVAVRSEAQVAEQDLFAPLAETAVQPLRAAAVRQRLVSIDRGQLDRARRASSVPVGRDAALPPGAVLRLNLFDDMVVTSVVERSAPTLSGGYSLTGRIVGEPMGDVVLVVNGDAMAGSVVTRAGTYSIESTPGGVVVSEVEDGPFDCQVLAAPSTALGVDGRNGRVPNGPIHFGRTPSVVSARNPTEEVATIDVAVFWTPLARARRGWHLVQMEFYIEQVVALADAAFRESGAHVRVKLVASEMVDYRAFGMLSTDLNRFEGDGDGHLDEVHAVRRRVSADVMMLIVDGYSGGGVARVGTGAGDAFAVVKGVNRPGVFVHEMGHVVGQLLHDRFNHGCADSPCTGSQYGFVNERGLEPGAPDSAHWRTIMSLNYRCEQAPTWCSLLHRFSNPDLVYPDPGGEAMGVPADDPSTGLDGPADAVRAINARRLAVAGFYQAPALGASFGASAYTATEGGAAATVTVSLTGEPTRAISIPIVVSGGPAREYSVPSEVVFGRSETSKTIMLTAVDDAVDEEDESVELAFGEVMPRGVTGSGSTTVTLKDDDTISAAPSVRSLELFPGPRRSGFHRGDDRIEAVVRFDKYVTVTGAPRLGLAVGNATRWATYLDAADEAVRFGYVVTGDDLDLNGVSIAANQLEMNGGTIRDTAAQDAVLTHTAVADDAGVPVDGVRPVLQSASLNGRALTLTYDEDLDSRSWPSSWAFTVKADGRVLVSERIRVAGREVRLSFYSSAFAGEFIVVAYSPLDRPIRDLAENPAASFSLSGAEVQNNSPPGEPPSPPPGTGGGSPPPGDDGEEDDGEDGGSPPPGDDGEEDDGDDGGGEEDDGGGGGGGPPRAAIGLDAECADSLCRARTGVPVSFEDASTGSVSSRRWEFGDGRQTRRRTVSHAWSSPGFYEVALWTSDGTVESTASLTFLVEAADPAGACVADAQTRCLQDSRYAVTADWWNAAGGGRGSVVRSGTNDSGLFHFFGLSNWEVLIKVLDGCAVNGHVWVFGASTTDLGYAIQVTDTVTGAVKEYRNEPGQPAAAITDGKAFRACAR